jgi:transposase InsO family protein
MGHFDKYLRELGVDHRVISTAHPRANGLIERYNRSIKEGLRKMSTLVGTIAWDELLPEVLAGLRMLPTRLGVSPHLIVFK